MITISRIYNETSKSKGYRILVDRLWPRGITKEKLKLDRWMKEIAPTDELRKWYLHDPEKWDEFKRRYFKELDKNPLAVELLDLCKKNDVMFLYSSKVENINNAVALKQYVEKLL